MKDPLIVNLFGAPGAGKSTGAAYIFSKLKMLGHNAELVTEFVKRKVWEENETVLTDQVYILGKQHYAQHILLNKVDVIVTDSPILLGTYYNSNKNIEPEFSRLVLKIFSEYNNINFLIKRVKKYNPSGRLQDEEGSDKVFEELCHLLNLNGVRYSQFDGLEEEYDKIITIVDNKLKEWN